MAFAALLIGNDQGLEVTGLKDEITGAFLNGATVTATVRDSAGALVAGGGLPIQLSYIPATNGDYGGILEDGLQLVELDWYTVEITAQAPSDRVAMWRFQAQARYRDAA